jgi:hypothetical protein
MNMRIRRENILIAKTIRFTIQSKASFNFIRPSLFGLLPFLHLRIAKVIAPANTTGFKKGVRNISLRIVYPCPYGLLLKLK